MTRVGCLGAPALISRMLKDIALPSAAIGANWDKVDKCYKSGTINKKLLQRAAPDMLQTQME